MNIDWSKLVTKAMKDAAAAAAALTAAKVELAAYNLIAVEQIARIQDRVDTIGYGIDVGEATEEDEAEQAQLIISLKVWKGYKFALGKVTLQPNWYQASVWTAQPPTPEIIAAPLLGELDINRCAVNLHDDHSLFRLTYIQRISFWNIYSDCVSSRYKRRSV